MNISRPFIMRPVATALLMGALMLSGLAREQLIARLYPPKIK